MSKSIKFKNNTYLDSRSIVHNKELLSDMLDRQLPRVYGLSIAGTYRIWLNTYKGFLMYGIYGGIHFASYIGFSGTGISIQHLGTGTPDLQSNFKFVANGVWDLTVPKSSDFDVLGISYLKVSKIS